MSPSPISTPRRLVVLLDGRVLLDALTHQVLAAADLIDQARMVPLPVVQLSQALGFLAMTPAEFQGRLRGLE